MRHKNRRHVLLQAVALLATLPAALVFADQFFPSPSQPWLSRKGIGSLAEADRYYGAIGAPPTFAQWQQAFFFEPDLAHATYYNEGDLGFGRDMYCANGSTYLSCYVVNHGLGIAAPANLSVNDAIDKKNELPTVAMVYHRAIDGQPNDVTFYVYDVGANGGSLLKQVALDSQGPKAAPQLCLACHGGSYSDTSHAVTGGNFLPFDLEAFRYSTRPGYTRAAQEDDFKHLNEMVLSSAPTQAIQNLIIGWYGGPGLPNATQDVFYTPPGYNTGIVAQDLYRFVVKPYCQTCHAASTTFPLANPASLDAGRASIFNQYAMPHAEKTAHNFWSSAAPFLLATNRPWSIGVLRRDDPSPRADCVAQGGSCSLREAIIKANTTPGRDIITFSILGTHQLSRSGVDDAAQVGDLDITDHLTILGGGADITSVDGNNIDRVFRIHPGADVVMDGFTIERGSTAVGGGIFNSGTKLTINSSIVRNNRAAEGAGIENRTVLEINNSAIIDNIASAVGSFTTTFGAGIDNRATFEINNSTVSRNSSADFGGGIDSDGVQATVRHSTIVLNAAGAAGGGIDNFGTTRIQKSIIAGNSGGDCANGATFVSLGANLVGQNGSNGGCPTIGSDKILAGGIGTAIDTNLNGAVPYHALVAGSPAIDAIAITACKLPYYDQRHQPRAQEGDNVGALPGCDIGAYEVDMPPAPMCQGMPATLVGTAGNDTLDGTPGVDVIVGLDGNDILNGRGGNDRICGGNGNDTLRGGPGNDVLDGGAGIDTISYSSSATAVTANLATNTGTGEGNDTFVAAENVTGSGLADILTGNGAANVLSGLGGNDQLNGAGGADTLNGDNGNDAMNGGPGIDTCNGGAGTGDTQTACETVTGVP